VPFAREDSPGPSGWAPTPPLVPAPPPRAPGGKPAKASGGRPGVRIAAAASGPAAPQLPQQRLPSTSRLSDGSDVPGKDGAGPGSDDGAFAAAAAAGPETTPPGPVSAADSSAASGSDSAAAVVTADSDAVALRLPGDAQSAAAATRIQAVQRGRVDRSRVREKRAEQSRLPARDTDTVVDESYTPVTATTVEVTVTHGAARGSSSRAATAAVPEAYVTDAISAVPRSASRVAREDTAAVRIQSIQRGRADRSSERD
jgi:hypothetical protein